MGELSKINNFFYPENGTSLNYNTDARNLKSGLMRTSVDRIVQDVLSWRESIREAEQAIFPFRCKVQRMYMDTVLNGHVSACMERRKDMVLLKEFQVIGQDKKINQKATDILQKQWFHTMMEHILDARFYGYSLINWGGISNNELTDIKVVRRANISPDRHNITSMLYSPHGLDFLDPTIRDPSGRKYVDWCLYIDTINPHGTSACGYGLLYNVALYEIFIRNNMGFNGDFVEKFVMPTIHAKTTKTDVERDDLEEDLKRMSASTAFITDLTDELTFIQNNSVGAGYKAYDNLEERCEKKISKIIFYHADALDSTPGKLGAKDDVEKAMEMVEARDCRWAENMVTDRLFPKLKSLGFNMFNPGDKLNIKNDNERYEIMSRENENSKEVAEYIKIMHDAGLEADPAQIQERTGVKVKKAIIDEVPVEPQMNGSLKRKIATQYAG